LPRIEYGEQIFFFLISTFSNISLCTSVDIPPRINKVTLTTLGLSLWPMVASIVHNYLGLLRGTQQPKSESGGNNSNDGLKWVYDEVASVAATQYRYP